MKRVEYISYFDSSVLIGVKNKIDQTVSALLQKGYDAESFVFKPRGLRGIFKLYKRLWLSKADVIIIRSIISYMIFLFPLLIIKRLSGVDIVIDVPTPYIVALDEIKSDKSGSFFARFFRILILRASFPWAWYPATRIMQYAPESKYFSFGINRKIRYCCNGVNVSNIKYREYPPTWPSSTFVFICVASIADWHGFDRVIRGMANYNKSSELQVKFVVIGDGESRPSLEKMAHDLGLSNSVEFRGYLYGYELDQQFERAHVAVSSLGLYRKGLDTASDLKSREYAARGIPFVSSGFDADFDPLPEFVFNVSNDGDYVDVEAVISWYSSLLKDKDVFMMEREFAQAKLDFSSKVDTLLGVDIKNNT